MDLFIKSIIEIIIYFASFYLFYLLYKNKHKLKGNRKIVADALDYKFKFDYKQVLFSIILTAVMFLFLFRLMPQNINVSYDTGTLIVLFLSMVAFAPIFEELLLRGSFLGFIMKRYRGNIFYFGFLLQLSLFVILHFTFNIHGLVYHAVGGLLFSLLFVFYKRNIVPSFASHIFWNYMVFLLIVF